MRTGSVLALLLLASASALAGPRESLDVPSIVTPAVGGAHDVVEAAGIGLTVGLLAHVIEPRVLRTERVMIDDEPVWRVDVAGHLTRDREGCSAVATWIAESGEVLRLAQFSEAAPIDDCRSWYFDGDERSIEGAIDSKDYRDEQWDDETLDRWDAWQDEVRLEEDVDR